MTYEETARPVKSEVKDIRITKTKKDKNEVSKEKFEKTKAMHKAEIQKLRQDIKKHKLLIKQARIMYKLEKMKGAK